MTEIETILRDECRQRNADSLSAVMAETGAQLPVATFRLWRPTVRNVGAIQGVSSSRATILATDGNLGLFVDDNGHFFGHIQHFSGEVKTLWSVNKPPGGESVLHEGVPGEASSFTPRKKREKAKPAWQKKADALLEDLGLT